MDRGRRAEPYSNATLWTREIARNLAGHLNRLANVKGCIDTGSPKSSYTTVCSPTGKNHSRIASAQHHTALKRKNPRLRAIPGRNRIAGLSPVEHGQSLAEVGNVSSNDGSASASDNKGVSGSPHSAKTRPDWRDRANKYQEQKITADNDVYARALKGLHSANHFDYKKKQQELKIWQENQVLARRLRSSKSTLKSKEWVNDEKRNQNYLERQEQRRIALQLAFKKATTLQPIPHRPVLTRQVSSDNSSPKLNQIADNLSVEIKKKQSKLDTKFPNTAAAQYLTIYSASRETRVNTVHRSAGVMRCNNLRNLVRQSKSWEANKDANKIAADSLVDCLHDTGPSSECITLSRFDDNNMSIADTIYKLILGEVFRKVISMSNGELVQSHSKGLEKDTRPIYITSSQGQEFLDNGISLERDEDNYRVKLEGVIIQIIVGQLMHKLDLHLGDTPSEQVAKEVSYTDISDSSHSIAECTIQQGDLIDECADNIENLAATTSLLPLVEGPADIEITKNQCVDVKTPIEDHKVVQELDNNLQEYEWDDDDSSPTIEGLQSTLHIPVNEEYRDEDTTNSTTQQSNTLSEEYSDDETTNPATQSNSLSEEDSDEETTDPAAQQHNSYTTTAPPLEDKGEESYGDSEFDDATVGQNTQSIAANPISVLMELENSNEDSAYDSEFDD